jgi:hypothetical protein
MKKEKRVAVICKTVKLNEKLDRLVKQAALKEVVSQQEIMATAIRAWVDPSFDREKAFYKPVLVKEVA